MFSGKTTELIRRVSGLPTESVLAVKHAGDHRYRADSIVSHTGIAIPARPVADSSKLRSLLTDRVEVVAIDEAHFFDAGLPSVVSALSQRGLAVVLTSLDRDSWGLPFVVAEILCELADEPMRKLAVCARCGNPADHTQRLTPIIGGDMIGGAESYEPRCRTCWRSPPEPRP